MLENVFAYLTEAVSGPLWLSAAASFAWGVLSILLSPCHLASIPLIIGYISSLGEMNLRRTILLSLVFAAGILITIACMGVVTMLMGRLMGDIGPFGNYFVAVIFFLVGLYFFDIVKLDWTRLSVFTPKTGSMLSALLLGLVFGLALGPCTFAFLAPVLGVIFAASTTDVLFAALILTSFAAGHCIVLALAGILTNRVQVYLNWTEDNRAIRYLKRICGVLIILGGVYLIYLTWQ